MQIDTDAIDAEREALTRRLVDLESDRRQIRERLRDLDLLSAITSRVLEGADFSVVEEAFQRVSSHREGTVRRIGGGGSRIVISNEGGTRIVARPRSEPDTGDDDSPQRIPSTQMVADLLEKFGGLHNRQEIRSMFAAEFGIPSTWSNPVNALNIAIARAVENDLIVEVEDGLFGAPPKGRS